MLLCLARQNTCGAGVTVKMQREEKIWELEWREVSGRICDKRKTASRKGKIYKIVVKPALMHGLERVALSELDQLKMLRFGGDHEGP